MSTLSHRASVVLKADSADATDADFGASYKVIVTPVGARVRTAGTVSTIEVDRGHSFRIGDKFLRNPGSDNQFSGIAVTSVAADSITFASAFTVVVGDLLVNLGPDAATASPPDYTTSPMKVYKDPDAGTLHTNATITCNSEGSYDYYHAGDGRMWELILDSSNAPQGVVQGFSGTTRLNVVDFGAAGDGTTNDATAIGAAITAMQDGDHLHFPDRDFELDAGLTISGIDNILIDGLGRLTCNSATTMLTLDDIQRGTVRDLRFEGNDTASTTAITVTKSRGVYIINCDIFGVQNGVDVADDTPASHEINIKSCRLKSTNVASSIGITLNDPDCYVEFNVIRGFDTGIQIGSTTNSGSQFIIGNHIYESPSTSYSHCVNVPVAQSRLTFIGNYFDNPSTTGLRLVDVSYTHVLGNLFLHSSEVPSVDFILSAGSDFAENVVTNNIFDYSAGTSMSTEIVKFSSTAHDSSRNLHVHSNTYRNVDATVQFRNTFEETIINTGDDTTPTVRGAANLRLNYTTGVTVTQLDNGQARQTVRVWAAAGFPRINNGGNFTLRGDWAPESANECITLHKQTDSSNWLEVDRSTSRTQADETITSFADADATPSVKAGTTFKTANTGPTTITDLDDGVDGQIVYVIFNDANTTIDLSGNANMTGNAGSDFTGAAGDLMIAILDGTVWRCLV